MAHALLLSPLIVFSFLFMSAIALVESNQKGHISAVLSEKGLDFAKDLLIEKGVSSMIPLQLSDIEKSVKIPVIGKARLALSDIVIYSVDVGSSSVETGDSGIVLVVSGATADLRMEWRYSYKPWLVPVAISDKGSASVQVQGMVVGFNAAIINEEGTLKLLLLDCRCHVKDISIKVDGGASWLYQGIVDAFQGKIASAVEDAIVKKIREGITKLDVLLHSLPKQMQVNSVVALNVTFVDDPLLSNSFLELEIDGLFTGAEGISVSSYRHKGSQSFLSRKGSAKMIEISLHENVFESAASVYFDENYMHWTVDKIPDQSLMNTDGWKHTIPQLYEQYPDYDMNLRMTVTSPPIIQISEHDIDTTISVDLTIEVLNYGEIVPVTCISLVISASCSAEIHNKNNLAGSIRLVNFTASLKWSSIGDLNMHRVQAAISTILETSFVPYLNSHLSRGFPLPIPHGFELQNAEIVRLDSRVTVQSDLNFEKRHDLNWLLQIYS